MGDGSLSQDEIDALLQGSGDTGAPDNAAASNIAAGASAPLSPEQNALRNTLRSIVSVVVSSLSGYLGGKTISLTNVIVESKSRAALSNDFPGRHVQVSMDYKGSLNGANLVLFTIPDAGLISSLMMSDEMTTPVELTGAHLSTIHEFTNQFLSSIATQLSSKIGGNIGTTPADVSIAESPAELHIPQMNPVKITYDFNIEGASSFKIYHMMDANIVNGIASQGQSQQQQSKQSQPMTDMSSVKFPQLDAGTVQGNFGDITLLLDVPMTLTVELGRTSRLVQEILSLGEGSIIELDKLAGEPVDLLVNGKLIAKGEVVVIDENFGVRVTDIVSPDERLLRINH